MNTINLIEKNKKILIILVKVTQLKKIKINMLMH
jgi:hypothetical protein